MRTRPATRTRGETVTARRSILLLSIHGYVAARPKLGRSDTGGQVSFVLEMARRLAREGHRVTVATRRFDGQPRAEAIASGASIVRIPCGPDRFVAKEAMHEHLAEFVTGFLAWQRGPRRGFDVVYSHYWDGGWSGEVIAEKLGVPHVHVPHSLGIWKRERMEVDSVARAAHDVGGSSGFDERIRCESLTYRACDRLIATSPRQAEILCTAYGASPQRIRVIPPGVDPERFFPVQDEAVARIRQRLGFRPHDVYALGRLAQNKGFDLLIQALPTLREIVGDARLQLSVSANTAAEQRLAASLRHLAVARGVEDAVVFRPSVRDDELADHYRAAGVFALPSRYEPFGMTAIEAMACGAPTVVTNAGGLSGFLDENHLALTVNPERRRELAGALARPLVDPHFAARLSVEGSRHVRHAFDWSRTAKATADVLEGAIASRHESPCDR